MQEQSLKQKALKGVFWSSIERLLTQAIQLVLGIIMARLLLPSDYGLIGMLAIFSAISASFVDSGLNSALIQKKDRTEEDYSTVFYFNLMVSAGCYLLLFVCAPLISGFYKTPALTPIIRVMFMTLIINSLCMVQQTKLTINMNFKAKTIISFLSVLMSGSLGVFLAYSGMGVWALVAQAIIGSVTTTLMLFIICRWKPLLVFSKQSFNRLFGFGSKLLGAGLVATTLSNLYTILIGRFFSPDQVGYYTRGMQMPALASSTISSVLQGVTYPVMTSVQDDRERMVSIYKRLIKTTGFFVIPCMTALAIISEPFVRFFLTEKWMPAVVLMQWICFARMFTPISALNMNILNAIGRSDLFLKIDLSKLPMAFIALAITLPFGIEVVVIGHFVTSFIAFFINAYYPGRKFGYGAFHQIKDLFPVMLCTVGMAIVMLGISCLFHSDLAKIVFCVIGGGGAYYIFAALIKINDIKEVNQMVLKIWDRIF